MAAEVMTATPISGRLGTRPVAYQKDVTDDHEPRLLQQHFQNRERAKL